MKLMIKFLKDGIRLAVDGNEPAVIQEIMERELNYLEERHAEGASVLSEHRRVFPCNGYDRYINRTCGNVANTE